MSSSFCVGLLLLIFSGTDFLLALELLILIAVLVYAIFYCTYPVVVKFSPPDNSVFVWIPDAIIKIDVKIQYRRLFFAKKANIRCYFEDESGCLRLNSGGQVNTELKEPHFYHEIQDGLKLLINKQHIKNLLSGGGKIDSHFVMHVKVGKLNFIPYPYHYRIVAPELELKISDKFYHRVESDRILKLNEKVAIFTHGTKRFFSMETKILNIPDNVYIEGTLKVKATLKGIITQSNKPDNQEKVPEWIYFKYNKNRSQEIEFELRNLHDPEKFEIHFDTYNALKPPLELPGENDIKTVKCQILFIDDYLNKIVQCKELELEYVIKPELGAFWIALDPGTTGSTICGYDSSMKEPIVGIFGADKNEIMPSICYVSPKREFKIGFEALDYLNANNRIFRSIKNLIGYDKKISLNDEKIQISASEVVKRMIEFMMVEFIKGRSKNLVGKEINKVVLAVPNFFTQNKIESFIKCVPSEIIVNSNKYKIPLVRPIYEAEAVAIYLTSRQPENGVDGKTIMICDFGGGTINISIVIISYEKIEKSKQTRIDIIARIGCAIGGDIITKLIAEYLWKFVPHFQSIEPEFNPFKDKSDTGSKEAMDDKRKIKIWLYDIAETLKICLNEKGNIPEPIDSPPQIKPHFKFIFDSGKKIENWYNIEQENDYSIFINPENLLENIINGRYSSSLNFMKVVEEILEDALNLAGKDPSFKGVDKVVLSGRGSKLVGIKEKIRDKLRIDDECFYEFSDSELKTCVCKGAAYYATRQSGTFNLSRKKALVNYVARIKDFSGDNNIVLIKAGTPFNDDGKIQDEIPIVVGPDSNLQILQIIGSSIEDAPRYKTNIINVIPIQDQGFEIGSPAMIQVILNSKDIIDVIITNGTISKKSSGEFVIEEVYNQFEYASLWHIT